eukprot:1574255-Prymnesium_polylepis.1
MPSGNDFCVCQCATTVPTHQPLAHEHSTRAPMGKRKLIAAVSASAIIEFSVGGLRKAQTTSNS